ncbi:SpoIIE family protein phosphatase [Rummeliibacillus sp. G93]|uniref:SpoIIE family protein phosphatase n=1 Tax=Rummeliibacillus sp. G93 TaxID=2939494 RepID=UPI00201BDFB7|nr:SpoIIE family protein phosphatase [Rummeliibacillus sp. G93]UQW97931.1 SpoIIE family protein phosphatase [Rummeliibacillus sp. G93]
MDELLDRAPCGFLSMTEDGTITLVNQTLVELLDYKRENLVGEHINLILTSPSCLFVQLYLLPLIALEGHVEELYITLKTKNGGEIPILINASKKNVIENNNIKCILIPIRQRNKYENELLIAKKDAEAALKAKHDAIEELRVTLETLESQAEELLRLNEQNQQFKIETKRELELARKIQQTSLTSPIQNKDIEMETYYKASKDLSGDIYGIYQLDSTRFGIILLDVMGHGISSALITMSLHALFHRLIREDGLTVEKVMKGLDNHLHELFQNNEEARHYCTAIFLLVDTDKQQIDYINAGHPSALWQDANSTQFELHSTTPPLGLFKNVLFESQTLLYKNSGRLLLYTDGVDPLGTEYLHPFLMENASLSLPAFKKKMLQTLSNCQIDNSKSDDQCFIIIDIK